MGRVPIRISKGRLSDIAGTGRMDWSAIRKSLLALEPGEVRKFSASLGLSVPRLRSTLLVIGNRIHQGEWRMATMTKGRIVHCFLEAREDS